MDQALCPTLDPLWWALVKDWCLHLGPSFRLERARVCFRIPHSWAAQSVGSEQPCFYDC